MPRTEIEIGNLRIVRVDSKNWQLFEYRSVDKRDGSVAEEWVALPSFHGTLLSALEAARGMNFPASGYKGGLDGAIREIKRLDKAFASEIRKAVGV